MVAKEKEIVADEAIDKIRSTLNRLVDDIHVVRAEMAKFKSSVQFDIQRLVELREKDVEQIKAQFQRQK